jgi:hypothetical protein
MGFRIRNGQRWRRFLLKANDLKGWLHRSDLTQLDKLLLILGTFNEPCQVKELKNRAREGGLKITDRWNPSASLGRCKGLAINTPAGWELTEAGRTHIRKLGVTNIAASAAQVRHDLRAELTNIENSDTRAFVEEAIKCFESELFRSAVVMSWLAAISVLYNHVQTYRLDEFNNEASKVDAKWKPAKTTDDLGRMKESDFLDRITAISIIGKNVRQQLGSCLTLRNSCGHPNSLKLGANTVAHHIEILLLNVYKVF